MPKLLKWINYWLVPINATPKERLLRIGEVGFCIGMISVTIISITIMVVSSIK